MQVTKRQALFILTLCFLANKVQRLPSLVSANLGRHGWLFFLILGVIDIIFLLFALWFNKLAKNRTTYQICKKATGSVVAKVIFVIFAVYYLANSILPFEAVHDIFANVLFDHLPWWFYGLILLFTIWYIANKNLQNIGRLSELYFGMIIISFVLLLLLGAFTTNFQRVLPLFDVDHNWLIKDCLHYSLWFGDFLIIYMLVGRIKQDDCPLGWPIIVTFTICTLALSFGYAIFYGLYQKLSTIQNNMISSISQFSLLQLDIGRIDWFLVLIFETSTVISSAVYICLSGMCMAEVFNVKKTSLICAIEIAVIYSIDLLFFKSAQNGAGLIADISQYFSAFMIIVMPIILQLIMFVFIKKTNNKSYDIPYKLLFNKQKSTLSYYKQNKKSFINFKSNNYQPPRREEIGYE